MNHGIIGILAIIIIIIIKNMAHNKVYKPIIRMYKCNDYYKI